MRASRFVEDVFALGPAVLNVQRNNYMYFPASQEGIFNTLSSVTTSRAGQHRKTPRACVPCPVLGCWVQTFRRTSNSIQHILRYLRLSKQVTC